MSDDNDKPTNKPTSKAKPPAKRTAAKPPAKRAPAKPLTPVERSFSLLEAAVSRGATPEELKLLMQIRAEVQAELAAAEYREAKAAFLSAIPVIKKRKKVSFRNSTGGITEYWYAPLEDIAESIRPYLETYGFSYQWDECVTPDGLLKVRCRFTHKSGHFEECTRQGVIDSSPGKNQIQMMASTSSYLRRYTLTGVAGIATADEDIDGRLPQTFDNGSTLSEILGQHDKQVEAARQALNEVNNHSSLRAAGFLIAEIPDGKDKEALKKEWYSIKRNMVTAAQQEAAQEETSDE